MEVYHAYVIFSEKKVNNVIIFVHIPKTAGTTLQKIINKIYKVEDFGKPWSPAFLPKEKMKIKVIKGHMLFGLHKQFPQSKFTYITLLRNPVNRIISMFYYVRENKKMKEYDLYNQLTFYEYVTEKRFNHATNNLQTYWISGTDRNDLKTAKKNLKEHFTIVGITERFSETLTVIKKELNWKIENYEKANVTRNKPSIEELPPEIINIILEKNQNDIELYQYANKLLDKKLTAIKNNSEVSPF